MLYLMAASLGVQIASSIAGYASQRKQNKIALNAANLQAKEISRQRKLEEERQRRENEELILILCIAHIFHYLSPPSVVADVFFLEAPKSAGLEIPILTNAVRRYLERSTAVNIDTITPMQSVIPKPLTVPLPR